jgi:hypothetical protein
MTPEKKAAISARIIAKIGEGLSLREAINAVLGEGRYEALVSDVYHTLRGEPVA